VFKIMRTVPLDIPVEAAALLCTWREVLGSFTDFRLHEVRRILVFGGGPVGLSFVRFARLRGMEYIGLVDSHREKRELAERFGAHETFGRDDAGLEKLDTAAAPRNWSLHYHQWPIRESEAAAQETLVEWVRSGKLDWREFVTSRYPIREIEKGIADIRARKAVKVLLDY
jgi:threonine dehydrogenase-like Zn-dependent dehydrogenase